MHVFEGGEEDCMDINLKLQISPNEEQNFETLKGTLLSGIHDVVSLKDCYFIHIHGRHASQNYVIMKWWTCMIQKPWVLMERMIKKVVEKTAPHESLK